MAKLENELMMNEVVLFDEASKILGMTKSYLYKLTHAHKVPFYKPNGKMIYFKRSELESWIFRNKVSSKSELDAKASTYVSSNPAGI